MFDPSSPINSLLTAVAATTSAGSSTPAQMSAGMRAAMARESEFPSPLAARLTGVALDPVGRDVADRFLDGYWADEPRRRDTLASAALSREVVVGSGFHAAVYCAIRVLGGHPRPLVLERDARAGGTFAMTAQPTFYLNSRNRAGSGGLAGDRRASLNHLPGAPIQAADVSMTEYQTNADMALVIRMALAQFADVVTEAEVLSVTQVDGVMGSETEIEVRDRPALLVGRVVDARGLGDPAGGAAADGSTILTFPQFMRRMATPWPLRGVRRVAVVGGGDSARCAVESLLGIAPPPALATATLDRVELIDWYSDRLPATCEEWTRDIRGRYQAIGRHLRPDRLGLRRLQVLPRRVQPVLLPGSALIDGRTYDLGLLCTGSAEKPIGGLEPDAFDEYATPDGTIAAGKHYRLPAFRIGPHARLPFTTQERDDGVADIPANAVSMFRTATKTAALAATLPALPAQ